MARISLNLGECICVHGYIGVDCEKRKSTYSKRFVIISCFVFQTRYYFFHKDLKASYRLAQVLTATVFTSNYIVCNSVYPLMYRNFQMQRVNSAFKSLVYYNRDAKGIRENDGLTISIKNNFKQKARSTIHCNKRR